LSLPALAAALLTGCGNQYRPVVSAISPVGPAGQPTKYAVAISNTNTTNQQTAVTGYTILNNVITVTLAPPSTGATSPFVAGASVTLSGFPSSIFLNQQTLTILPTGLSATQFQANYTHANASSNEVAIASVTGSALGLVNFVDFSGDTIITTPQIQTNPSYFQLNTSGSEGYVINAQGSLDYFGTSNPNSLITSNIGQTTLSANSQPISITVFTPASGTSTAFIPEVNTSSIAALNSGTLALYDTVRVGPNPYYVVGTDGAARVYAISQGAIPGTSNGTIAAIETASQSSLTVSATLNVGVNPVYGIMTSDVRRAFILNKGSGTVSVLNVATNNFDATTPTITIPPIAIGAGTTPSNPVWAALSPLTSELVVLNQGDGVHNGTLSIISIPLCNPTASNANPNCTAANPVDAAGFGTIVATVPVGVNPVMVSVLQDGSVAYVANAGILPIVNEQGVVTNPGTPGSVTVVNLVSGTVTATINGVASPSSPTAATALNVYGHPNSIAATSGNPAGKVYVTAPDSVYMTLIYTDTNTVQNHITLQGNGLRVLTTSP
jgi:hypothetical protein